MTTIPSDSLFPYQWHLYNPGGLDLNVANVWDDYTGNGVLVAVIDDGFDYLHSDLNDNYDSTIDYDSYDNDSNPFGVNTDGHGTSVAGIIGAERNGIGVVGIAFSATLTAFRAYSDSFNNDLYKDINGMADALWRAVNVDVANNSWGFSANFFDNFNTSLFSSAGQAITNAVANGRGGLGTAIVFAAGNDRENGNNTNYHNFQNSRHVITVAALKNDGSVTSYSTPGASILVSAFGSEPSSIVTTDRRGSAGYNSSGDYTGSFDGTSAAAPMVSGVVALMLEANPNLGYRDIQEILAYSARGNSAWEDNGANNWNGGGLHVSHDLGFGLVDALAAVRLAETWQAQSTYSNEYYMRASRSNVGLIPDGNTGGITSTITMSNTLQIDFVEVFLDLTHPYRGDLVVSLISPTGTESVLVNRPGNGSDAGDNIIFNLSSSHHWGENSAGNWTLWARDLAGGDIGYLNSWTLSLFGDLETANDTYVYTNEFSNYTSSSRRTLTDTSGIDIINAAAITSNSYINLTPGTVSSLDSNTLSISTGTVIEKAFSGDGNDTIIGNSAANNLNAGRGNDSLDGGTGNDTLDAETGNDTLIGGTGNDKLYGGAGNDSLVGSAGTNTLYGGTGNDFYTVSSDTSVTIFEYSGEGIDTVLSSFNNFSLGAAFLENLTLTGTGNINGTGNNFDNTITGNSGNNTLNSGDGNDVIYGGFGTDSLLGGNGNDTLDSGTPTAYDTANETLDGGAGNDYLLAGIGRDSLVGGTGNDTLVGGAGNDTLTSGTGSDFFVFYSRTEGIDRITDFSVIDDTIAVSAAGFGGGLVANFFLSTSQFRIGTAATTTSHRFIYNNVNGSLFFDQDGNSSAIAQLQIATLSTGLAMTNNDILVIA